MKKLRNLMIVFLLLLGSIFVTLGLLYNYYSSPVSRHDEEKKVVIESGISSGEIGQVLKENNLIKNETFFKIYLKLFNINDLKAGTYLLKENMSLDEIVELLEEGNSYNEDEIEIKFPEGINMRKIATIIENNTNNSYSDVMKKVSDKEYLNKLIDEYWFIEKDILDSDVYYALEGYLFPDTYRFNSKDVTVEEIFDKLIKQMDMVLTPYKNEMLDNEYSVHELLTLASMAELEVSNKFPDDRKRVVSVFMNRLSKRMNLGSDVTTRYALKVDESRALTSKEYATVNPYNTRSDKLAGKLPVGPIGMISKSSILAVLYPDDSNNLYFISNIETGETFFYEKYSDFLKKKDELAAVNRGY